MDTQPTPERTRKPLPPLDTAPPSLMKAEEAARYLRFSSVRAFRKWAKKNGLEALRAGRKKLLWSRSDLDTFIGLTKKSAQEEQPTPSLPSEVGEPQEVSCHG